jgi:hypothetical protein
MTSTAPQITSAERHADDPNGDQASGIVVGVDGSDGAASALRWALDEGARRGWAVTALMAWT